MKSWTNAESLASRGCRIDQLHLCRGRLPPQKDFLGMILTASDGGTLILRLCHCHCSLVCSGSKWWHLVGSNLWVKWNCLTIELCANKWLILNWIVRNRTVWPLTVCKQVKLATVVEGDPKATFSIVTTLRCRGGRYSFPTLHLILTL